MLRLAQSNGNFSYSIFAHPLSRVLKFEYIKKYFNKLEGGRLVLDYGSGDRPYEQLLLTKFSRYMAADYEVTNREHSRRPEIYITGDHLDIASDSVCCVVLTEVLEHVYEPAKVLRELHRILKPGGRLIGTVPFVVSEHEEPYDFYRYTYYALQRMFHDSEFKIIALDYVGDNVSVSLVVMYRIFSTGLKALDRAGLRWIAYSINVLLKFPEMAYLAGRRLGLDPQRVAYFRKLPVGFAFCLEKPALNDSAAL